ncbi:MAG: sigma-54-dependent transcriptional regulator [Candidatus Kapaibacterium sp.]
MKVLIVDDNPDYCSTIEDIVNSFGFDTQTLNSPTEALEYISKQSRLIGLALFDIEFGPDEDMSGLDLLKSVRKEHPGIPVVMITGKGTIEMAVQATKLGAINFIEKSIVNKIKIKEVLDSAVSRMETREEAEEIKRFLAKTGIIAKSRAMLDVGDKIIRFGRTDLNVLITGDTGTGKKLVAKAIHAASRRGKFPFVTVDIPNIPKELFQSELFGHHKGAFSGATETKKGLFHEANKGTLFLDEIGDLSMDLQANLFLPIEERKIRRVGSVQNEEIDIRFISATDKDLLEAMKDSRFREQLYHRLRECEIHLPPLQDRKEDIPDIVDYYVKKHNEEFREDRFLSPSTMEYLQEHSWPGNVRELASVIRVSLQTAQQDQIEVNDLHSLLQPKLEDTPREGGPEFISTSRTLREDLAQLDRKKIEATLEKCGGNVSKSAAQLGISRETLHNKIRRYGVNVQQYRKKGKK